MISNCAVFISEWSKHKKYSFYHFVGHLKSWLVNFENPVHVLVSEELLKNTLWELYKLSNFLNFPVSLERLWCVKYNDESQKAYLRQKPEWLNPKNLFDPPMKQIINNKLMELANNTTLNYNISHALRSYVLL